MEKIKFFQLFNLEPDKPSLPANQRSLYRTLYAILYYVPILSLFIAIGFGIIFLLGLSGLLDKNEPRLLFIAGFAIATSALHIPIFMLMKKNQLSLVALFLLILYCTASSLQVFAWQGIVWLPVIVSIFPIIIFLTHRGIEGKYRAVGIIFGIASIIFVLVLDRVLTYPRMSVGTSLTDVASLAIYILVITAMAILVILNSQINFRSISGRLATTFTFIALLSSIATLIIAALANLYFDRQKIFNELNASSIVRAKQVEVAFTNLQTDANLTLSDWLNNQLIQTLLETQKSTSDYQNTLQQIQSYLLLLQSQTSKYQEIILIDAKGKVLFSTSQKNTGFDFSTYAFFQNSKMGINFAIENNFPTSFDKSSIILTRPFFQNGILQGMLAVRANFDSIKQILSANTGIGNTAETYLVEMDKSQLIPLTNTIKNTAEINTFPAKQGLMNLSDQGSGIWDNYLGVSVIGSYTRIPAIKSVLIAEIEQAEVTQKTINIALTNGIIGLFTLLFTFTIVFITSRSIGLPIVDLVEKATNLSKGDLTTRILVNRHDEIGVLASSFNDMAAEIESLVKTLEGKVDERTQDLQKQTNYLRVAAEVARDATTAQSLDELLNRAAQLVLDRFGFYHTGIFLLDNHKEFAVLRASPTKAGQEMLSRNHRLKVGQVGIVGNVAATGESRIALDTGQDTAYFNNPLLPNTRSEMALPLKVNNEMIGVLDVQSDQSEAFSQDDIGILQIMADQLALAIQRVRLTEAQTENMRELESAYQKFTFTSWSKLSQGSAFKQGYSFDGMNLLPITSMPPDIQDILAKGQSVVVPGKNKNEAFSNLAVPVKIRDQVIGALSLQFSSKSISPYTIKLVEETAGRLAIALENARLYSETQKSADRERTVSEITSKIRSTNDPTEMIQIALNELKQTLRINNARILPFTPTQKPEKN